jgi:lysophospholipase L1-like esterase
VVAGVLVSHVILGGVTAYGGTILIDSGTAGLAATVAADVRIMPLGDSITTGFGSSSSGPGYRWPLYNLLNDSGLTFHYVGTANNRPGSLPTTPVDQTYHEGHGGWNVAQLLNGVTPTDAGGLGWLEVDPQIILLMIGTNNRGGDVPTAVGQVGQIIDQIQAQTPDARLLVAEITPITGQEAWVASYNSSLASLVNGRISAGENLGLVDMNTNFPVNSMYDALHPNDAGYAWMAQQWNDAILIPEPSVLVLLATSALGAVGLARRRQRIR